MLLVLWRLLKQALFTLQSLLEGQQAILAQLEQILDILNPGPAVELMFTAQLEDGTTVGIKENKMDPIRDDQKVRLSIKPLDSKKQPAALDGVPVWAGSDDTVFTLQPASDGLSAMLTAVAPNAKDADGVIIPARVVVTCDADLGSGVTSLTGTTDVVVTAGTAVTLEITADPPANQ